MIRILFIAALVAALSGAATAQDAQPSPIEKLTKQGVVLERILVRRLGDRLGALGSPADAFYVDPRTGAPKAGFPDSSDPTTNEEDTGRDPEVHPDTLREWRIISESARTQLNRRKIRCRFTAVPNHGAVITLDVPVRLKAVTDPVGDAPDRKQRADDEWDQALKELESPRSRELVAELLGRARGARRRMVLDPDEMRTAEATVLDVLARHVHRLDALADNARFTVAIRFSSNPAVSDWFRSRNSLLYSGTVSGKTKTRNLTLQVSRRLLAQRDRDGRFPEEHRKSVMRYSW